MNRLLPTALIVLLLIAFRIVGSAFPETLPNFQPLAALFFCGALMAKGWRGWAIPLAAWALTYPAPTILSGNSGYLVPAEILTTGVAFAATFFIGKKFSEAGFTALLGGSLAAALAFHLITNGAAWIGSPMYPKSPLGLWQSIWAGPSGSAIPSWVFLRNMACANLLFTTVFLSARFALPRFSPQVQPAAAR
jgi:hypothetical protein